jgi:hypothetical protein
MTRALGVALLIAAAIAAAIVGLLYLFPPPQAHRRLVAPPSAAPAGPARVSVLLGETPERAVVVKRRFSGDKQADFTDRSFAAALGVPEGRWRFVEVWVINRTEGDLRSLERPPTVSGTDGIQLALAPLRDLLPPPGRRTSRAEMLVSALAPDPAVPLRNGRFRRTVYAMPASVGFRDLASADVDGVRLGSRETTEEALESFLERPKPDPIAALMTPGDAPATSSRVSGRTEDSR